jgi:hypothetical protein
MQHPGPKKLGIPIISKSLPRSRTWKRRTYEKLLPADSNWPFAWLSYLNNPMEMLNNTPELTERFRRPTGHGSVLVAREGKKPLRPEHMHAMIECFEEKSRICCASGNQGDVVGIFAYLDPVSKDDFERFWSEWVEKRKTEHPKITAVPSPYAA